jgi:hypothetical protein
VYVLSIDMVSEILKSGLVALVAAIAPFSLESKVSAQAPKEAFSPGVEKHAPELAPYTARKSNLDGERGSTIYVDTWSILPDGKKRISRYVLEGDAYFPRSTVILDSKEIKNIPKKENETGWDKYIDIWRIEDGRRVISRLKILNDGRHQYIDKWIIETPESSSKIPSQREDSKLSPTREVELVEPTYRYKETIDSSGRVIREPLPSKKKTRTLKENPYILKRGSENPKEWAVLPPTPGN